MKDESGKTVWNIYAKQRGNAVFVELPDEHGQLDEQREKEKDGFLISWPVNPHFTGGTGIIEQLQRFKDWNDKQFHILN